MQIPINKKTTSIAGLVYICSGNLFDNPSLGFKYFKIEPSQN